MFRDQNNRRIFIRIAAIMRSARSNLFGQSKGRPAMRGVSAKAADALAQSNMKSRIKLLAVGVFLGISAALLFACGPAPNAPQNTATANSPSPAPSVIDELAGGRELFKQNCSSCHGDTGVGGKKTVDGKEINARDLTSDRMKARADEKLFRNISDGAPDDGMPAFKDKLTDSQIKETVRFIRAELQKLPVPAPK